MFLRGEQAPHCLTTSMANGSRGYFRQELLTQCAAGRSHRESRAPLCLSAGSRDLMMSSHPVLRTLGFRHNSQPCCGQTSNCSPVSSRLTASSTADWLVFTWLGVAKTSLDLSASLTGAFLRLVPCVLLGKWDVFCCCCPWG